jgi:Fur family peroxide stress response transcriptional regulator
MADGCESLQQRVAQCEEALRAAGVRVTQQRLEIFRNVATSKDHPDAETVFNAVRKSLPTVSLDTVYRTLWLLTDLGLITTLGLPRERFRFDGNIKPHHHFVCTRCGLTGDFYSQELDRLSVAEAVDEFGVAHRTQVEVRGVCRACLASEAGNRAGNNAVGKGAGRGHRGPDD